MSRTTTSELLWLPSAADAVSLTPNASVWTFNTTPVEITPSAPTDMYPAFVTIWPNNGAIMTELSIEVELMTGAASAEVPFGRPLRSRFKSDQWGPRSTIPLGLLYDRIATGTRVSVRMRHGVASDTDIYRFALGYYAALGGATGKTTQVSTNTPDGSASASVSYSAQWTYGSWTQIISSLASTSYFVGLVVTTGTTMFEIEIGIGSAPNEVKVGGPYPFRGNDGAGVSYFKFPNPLRIPSGSRVSMRCRGQAASGSFFATLHHVPIG